eukprot:m51a1_g11448 putative oligosaccharyl transferase-like protein (800) ;mRNA; f:8265-10976
MVSAGNIALRGVAWALAIACMAWSVREAYEIRLYAVRTFGRVIHEFDPWFNFRAAQYLADNGWRRFFTWYDYRSWYPIGRPIGTTIFPGMQFTAVWLWRGLNWAASALGLPRLAMSLNDVCVFIPAWFGGAASVAIGLMTLEATGGSLSSAAAACAVMAVIPAHLMRSIGGKFDNECVAVAGMCAAFWLWLRSLRTERSWPVGLLAGLAYAYMAASWGGYTFCSNMVALHAALLVAAGRYSEPLRRSYSLFWLAGSLLAWRVPIVGAAPLRSVELLLPLAVFVGLQLMALCESRARARGISWRASPGAMLRLHAAVGAAALAVLAALVAAGFFWGASVRIRSLFIKHTRTGNPLVDSVSEHQPASKDAYWTYLGLAYPLMPVGAACALLCGTRGAKGSGSGCFGVAVAKTFPVAYGMVAYYFATRMSRLVLMMGPVAASLAGIAIGCTFDWGVESALALVSSYAASPSSSSSSSPSQQQQQPQAGQQQQEGRKGPKNPRGARSGSGKGSSAVSFAKLRELGSRVQRVYSSRAGLVARVVIAVGLAVMAAQRAREFYAYCHKHAEGSSQPSIMFRTYYNGQYHIVKDYLEAYEWLRDNTPEDSRVLAWWDYGYHISGIANRTSIADGNTWNLEHIATIGRIMTAPEHKGWKLARRIADYVLVWAGHHRDDISKSRHLARIGASVYDDVCPKNDPLCHSFSVDGEGRPTKSMAESMLFKMHSGGIYPNTAVNPKFFKEVYTSRHGLVRVYEILGVDRKAKQWLADPANRVCDHPGSWYCVGQYPPGFPVPPKSHRHITYDD